MRQIMSLGLLFFASQTALAHTDGPWGEPHLNALPRTPAETARIKAALDTDPDGLSPFEGRPAGAATVMSPSDHAPFSHPSEGMSAAQNLDFILGEALFEKLWVQAPASTISSDGLGPLYNARACSGCHLRDGRGHPPSDDVSSLGLVLKFSQTGADGTTLPDPTYGFQLQDRAITGHLAEASLDLRYRSFTVPLADGSMVDLRKPDYHVLNPAYGPLGADTMTSPRVAPQMIGLGLLEAIPEADILAGADPNDADGDGISGRPNRVWSREFDQWMLGRFGHKAGNPTLRQQSAEAANGDIGLSSHLFPAAYGDCTAFQAKCQTERDGNTAAQNNAELGDVALDLMTFYAANLAVPARPDADRPEVLRGKALFHQAGCASCHTPAFVTHRLPDDPQRSFQLIWPYTDLLLHDMGDGLADNRPEGQASGREWRTPPLWGIGRTAQVSGQISFLHDGRARSLLEAIMWHGGEAAPARSFVQHMAASGRADLISFLESL